MQFETAVEIAARAHRGQRDKEGEAYLLHPLRVALAVSERARCVAVLHDVLEDAPEFTRGTLKEAGLSVDELDALELLTRRGDETYGDFIARIVAAP